MPGYAEVQYLHARSYHAGWQDTGGVQAAQLFLRQRLAATWTRYGIQEQAMIALALHRYGDRDVARDIMTSLAERATHDAELGMYWKSFRSGPAWNAFPAETHALLIEAFHEVADDGAALSALRQYLLGLKRSTDWGSTKAAAHAVFALLYSGDDLLIERPAPALSVGGVALPAVVSEAGTGFLVHGWPGEAVKPSMARVTVTTTTDGLAWGALHWQYFEQLDKVQAHEGPFTLRRQVYRREAGAQGTELRPVRGAELRPGDRITVRLELRTDRWLDHVQVKDQRAAGLEPVEALSGHRHQGGLGYYQAVRDASMHFFMDRLPPGTHVLEYDLRVTHAGSMANGLASAQCMYAPEFGTHSSGERLEVGAR